MRSMNVVPARPRKLHCKSELRIGKHASSCAGDLRPVLGSVVNASDFHNLIFNPIDDYVRQSLAELYGESCAGEKNGLGDAFEPKAEHLSRRQHF